MVSCYSRLQRFLSPFALLLAWIEARPVGVLARCDRVRRGAQAFRRQTRCAPLILYTKKMLTGLLFWLPEARLASELEKIERLPAPPRHSGRLAASGRPGTCSLAMRTRRRHPRSPSTTHTRAHHRSTPRLFRPRPRRPLRRFHTREHPIAPVHPGAKGLQCRREKEPVREVGVMISCGLR